MLLLFLRLLQTAGKQPQAQTCSCKIGCLITPNNKHVLGEEFVN